MSKDEYIEELIAGEETETVNLAGFQVAKAELFAHTREPAMTVWAYPAIDSSGRKAVNREALQCRCA